MVQATVITANGHTSHQFIATANCFFFGAMEVNAFLQNLLAAGKDIAVRPSRIEVTDAPAPLHSHNGYTVVFIVSGFGLFKTEHGDYPVRVGDVITIPPGVLHLSVAAPHTVLIEHSVFIGDRDDFEAIEAGSE